MGVQLRKVTIAVLALLGIAAAIRAGASFAGNAPVTLPNGWVIEPPRGLEASTGTMPQGMALSPDGATIAVVESGYRPASLGLYRAADLTRVASIPLKGAFGRPYWRDGEHVLVAGANADALFDVNTASKAVATWAFPKGSYPAFVAVSPDGKTFAVACDGDGTVHIGPSASVANEPPVKLRAHPGGIAFGPDGTKLYVTDRADRNLFIVDVASRAVDKKQVGLHPSAIAVDGDKLYVAESDADSVAVMDRRDLHVITDVRLGDGSAPFDAVGVSPNAVAVAGDTVYVTLGAANSVAVLRGDRVVGRLEAGWYPTDAFVSQDRLFVLNGKGEGATPNPGYRSHSKDDSDYIGSLEVGSLRTYDLKSDPPGEGNPQGSDGWSKSASTSVVRPNGPIRHVFFVLKENRSYDQVLGDVPQGNGDASLAWFGTKVTPNEHAVAKRFGLFDNAYTSGEVSSAGHMWAETAFANDYVERFWPPMYGGRRETDDLDGGDGARVPSAGYLWDAARRAHVSFRDYGELVDPVKNSNRWTADVPSLNGKIDPLYAGWDLDYSDLDRVKEWKHDFAQLASRNAVPQLEFIWLPNDHTYGSKPGKLTPSSYVALNDYALGQMIDTLSHSKIWRSSAMFVIEDDAQDGPDHVSDQRTTMFVVSPYARGGVRHEHYATVSLLRTMEVLLGMRPLSTYDSMAVPMFAAFGAPDFRSYAVMAPQIDVRKRNTPSSYGAKVSATLNFSKPDAVPEKVLNDILSRNH